MSKMNGHGMTYPPGTDTMPINPDLVFLTAKGTNLERCDMMLPRDFEGALNLVFVAFKVDSSTVVFNVRTVSGRGMKNAPTVT